MSKHAPMHVNPHHPMWWGLPLAVTGYLLLAAGSFGAFAVRGDAQAWPGAVTLALLAGASAWFTRLMWRETR